MATQTASQRAHDMQECIKLCGNCYSTCLTTVQHCLKQGGPHADPQHIGLLLNCADICQASYNFMLRDSPLHKLVCGVCAEVCTQCAESCEALAANDAFMKACAEACRQCAEMCRQMAAH